jgi:hypothetical protein
MSERLLGALRWPLRGLLDHVLRGPPSMAQTKQQKNVRGMFACPLISFRPAWGQDEEGVVGSPSLGSGRM